MKNHFTMSRTGEIGLQWFGFRAQAGDFGLEEFVEEVGKKPNPG